MITTVISIGIIAMLYGLVMYEAMKIADYFIERWM